MSPHITRYLAHKQIYKGALLLQRLGDFYEAYGDDAALLAQTCNLTLQVRIDAQDNRTAMCGFPCHAIARFEAVLEAAGVFYVCKDED